jgi:hypothetical protein
MAKHEPTRRRFLSHALAGSGAVSVSYLALTRDLYAEASGRVVETRTEGPRLNFWDDNWENPEDCDVHLIEWLDEKRITDAAIYHFGTGGHHRVGIECAKPERRNSVLGITAAPREYDSYVRLVTERPEVLRYYNAVFGDIYLLNEKLLPTFDVLTLFHLCEFRGPRTDAYGGLTDLDVTNLLTSKTRPGGHILFYTRSYAFGWNRSTSAKTVIAQWEKEHLVERVGEYKSLLVYRKAV